MGTPKFFLEFDQYSVIGPNSPPGPRERVQERAGTHVTGFLDLSKTSDARVQVSFQGRMLSPYSTTKTPPPFFFLQPLTQSHTYLVT